MNDIQPCCEEVYNRTHYIIEKFIDPTKGRDGSLYLAFICSNCGTIMQGRACEADSKEPIYSALREINFVRLDSTAHIKPVDDYKSKLLNINGSLLPAPTMSELMGNEPILRFPKILKAKYFTLLDCTVVLSCIYYIA